MSSHSVQLLFLDLAIILLLSRILGALAARVRQPPVIGEIIAGALLGPLLFDGAIAETLFPDPLRPMLAALANVGVALFMLLVGLEIEHTAWRSLGRATVTVALGSTLVPFVLGAGLGVYLLRHYRPEHPVAFVAYLGIAVSVTAFPVLARILADRGLLSSAVGGVSLGAAAIVDVAAWTALAVVQASLNGGRWVTLLLVPYGLVLVFAVRPLLRRLLRRSGPQPARRLRDLAIILSLALLSGAATEAMSLHFIFGAFIIGVILPRGTGAALLADLRERTGQLTSVLLPVYFVVAGLQVRPEAFRSPDLIVVGLILAVAIIGKGGGTYLGARLNRIPRRPAAAVAALMNTRGLTELVILGIGLQTGLIDGELFSLLLVMAVLTTVMTGPLLSLIYTKPVEIPPVGRPDAEVQPTRDELDRVGGMPSRGTS